MRVALYATNKIRSNPLLLYPDRGIQCALGRACAVIRKPRLCGLQSRPSPAPGAQHWSADPGQEWDSSGPTSGGGRYWGSPPPCPRSVPARTGTPTRKRPCEPRGRSLQARLKWVKWGVRARNHSWNKFRYSFDFKYQYYLWLWNNYSGSDLEYFSVVPLRVQYGLHWRARAASWRAVWRGGTSLPVRMSCLSCRKSWYLLSRVQSCLPLVCPTHRVISSLRFSGSLE